MNLTPDQQQCFYLGGVAGVFVAMFLEWVDKQWPF